MNKCFGYGNETEWIECKSNDISPKDIGACISSMSNSAAMPGEENVFLFFGVNDTTHEIEGTEFDDAFPKHWTKQVRCKGGRIIMGRIFKQKSIACLKRNAR